MDAKIAEMNNELKSLADFCRDNLTEQEIQKLCEPLKKAQVRKRVRWLTAAITIALIAFASTHSETVCWHVSAIGRIVLIKILPIWDWTTWKNEKCLIDNVQKIEDFNCALCESLGEPRVQTETSAEVLNDNFVKLHVPVVIPFENWPLKNRTLLNQVENKLHDSIPCKLSSNIQNGRSTVGKILKKLPNFDSYFLHFQNCDFGDVKEFRSVAPRPHFLVAEMAPIQYSWLLVSKDYDVDRFKFVELSETIGVVVQVVGGNVFRLKPRKNCEAECPILEVELNEGEALIMTSLWDLEYRPFESGENICVILETHY